MARKIAAAGPDRTLYAVLGVEATASADDIRSAYRKQALATHPDKGGSKDAFQEVVRAVEILSSSKLRAAYDTKLNRAASATPTEHPSCRPFCQTKRRLDPEVSCAKRKFVAEVPSSDACPHRPLPCEPQFPSNNGHQRAISRGLRRLCNIIAKFEPEGRRELFQNMPMTVRLALLKFMEATGGVGSCSASAKVVSCSDPTFASDDDSESDAGSSASENEARHLGLEDMSYDCDSSNDVGDHLDMRHEDDEQDGGEATQQQKQLFACQHQEPLSNTARSPAVPGHAFFGNDAQSIRRGQMRGVTKLGDGGYRARAYMNSMDNRTRRVSSLEEAVELHTVLISVGQIVMEEQEGIVEDFGDRFRTALSDICSRHRIDVAAVHLSFGVVTRWRSMLGMQDVRARITTDLDHASRRKDELVSAKAKGWTSFRSVWIDAMQDATCAQQTAWGRALARPKSLTEAESFADAAWERGRAHRLHRLSMMREQAERAISIVQKRMDIEQVRAVSYAKRVSSMAARTAAAKAKVAASVEKAERSARWQWMRDPSRTIDEIMHGPSL